MTNTPDLTNRHQGGLPDGLTELQNLRSAAVHRERTRPRHSRRRPFPLWWHRVLATRQASIRTRSESPTP
jgi:hypothetical protein